MNKGYKLGLALGSGSARGYAHIGALQVLNERFDFDVVTGSSMGAVIGACYCTGSDMFFLEKLICQMNQSKFWDVTVPRKGFVKGEKIEELLKLLTKNRDFEEADIPFGVVACEVSEGKSTLITQGKIYEGVRASMSIPGVFIPYKIGDKLYVDGGVTDRVPVHGAKQMGADFVIGIDVGYSGESREEPQNTLETIIYSFDIMGWEITKQHLTQAADYVMVPKVGHLNSFAFGQAKEFIKAGRQAAEEALPEITRQLERFESRLLKV